MAARDADDSPYRGSFAQIICVADTDAESEAHYRQAVQVPGAAHCALEYYRWAVRSLTRPSGLRFLKLLDRGVGVPTLQLHGELDRCVLPDTARGSDAWVDAPYDLQVLPGVGHFPHQEAPELVSAARVEHAGGRRAGA